MNRSWLILMLIGAGACATTPLGTPGEVAEQIVVAFDEDRPGDAQELFERAARQDAFAEKLYPLLYGVAEDRHGDTDAAGATEVLRFMLPHYPTATAVPEALLYCLFLQRAARSEPEQALLDEIDSVLEELRRRGGSSSAWVDLIEAQQAIDRRELPEARAAYDRFLGAWDGQPVDLAIYVEDIDRYLTSH